MLLCFHILIYIGHRWLPSQNQWRGALMFSLTISAWTNCLTNDRIDSDLGPHWDHYAVSVLMWTTICPNAWYFALWVLLADKVQTDIYIYIYIYTRIATLNWEDNVLQGGARITRAAFNRYKFNLCTFVRKDKQCLDRKYIHCYYMWLKISHISKMYYISKTIGRGDILKSSVKCKLIWC